MLNFNSLYFTDGYKIGHKAMLAPGTTKLYGTWIPRSLKHAPKGIKKIISFGQQMVWKFIHEEFQRNFFAQDRKDIVSFIKDMNDYLGIEYDGEHFLELYDLGYLPLKVKALPEGIETLPNIPHMTFVNTVDGFAWLTLYLETVISSLAWKPATSATIALQYRRVVEKYIKETDPDSSFLIPFLCHDFSARGLSPWDCLSSGLGHATSFRGSDTLPVIPAARHYYNEVDMPVNSVNASEHSVSTTKIFTVGEQQMIADWLKLFPKGILSIVSDTFDLWKLITEFLPANKEAIMARDGKLVIRPDSGDPVDIICGKASAHYHIKNDDDFNDFIVSIADYQDRIIVYKDKWYLVGDVEEFEAEYGRGNIYDSWNPDEFEDLLDGNRIGILIPQTFDENKPEQKGVIELLWDIFGGTVNEQGYKVLDPHIGAIYGDSITLDRQTQIYERLKAKGFASSNIVLGIGSFTYQFNTRDTFGFAAKGAWFEVEKEGAPYFNGDGTTDYPLVKVNYDIYKDPVTDDGTKKSLKGLCAVKEINGSHGKSIIVETECLPEEEEEGLLQVIYENGKFPNQTSLEKVRKKIDHLATL